MSYFVIPKSGKVIEGMPFEEYKALPQTNQSYLKRLIEKSPLHAEYERNNPSPSTASMQVGTLQHEVFFGEIDPERDLLVTDARRGTKAFNELAAAAGDRQIVKTAEYAAAMGMLERVPGWLRKEVAGMKKEVTILFELHSIESDCVLECKARIDLLGEDVIGDYKTTSQGIDERSFQRMLGTYFYDLQAAFYQLACKAAFGKELPFQWIVQETSAPYDIAGYKASDENLANGMSWLNAACQKLEQCRQSGDFRGIWNGVFSEIDSPDWHLYEPVLETTGIKEVSTL